MQGTDQKMAQHAHRLGRAFKPIVGESKQLLLN